MATLIVGPVTLTADDLMLAAQAANDSFQRDPRYRPELVRLASSLWQAARWLREHGE